jgi:hypothetical protein
MRNPKFLLTLLLGGIVIIGAGIFLTTVGRTFGQFFFGRSFAESQLRSYVSSVQRQEVNGVSCQPMDTDGNGYVSCDYTLVSQPNVTRSIECAAWGLDGFFHRGCKVRVPTFQTP